jgi:hypothetical protein
MRGGWGDAGRLGLGFVGEAGVMWESYANRLTL